MKNDGKSKIIKDSVKENTGELYNSLSEEQKNELILSYHESFDANNLLDHEEVKSKYSNWL